MHKNIRMTEKHFSFLLLMVNKIDFLSPERMPAGMFSIFSMWNNNKQFAYNKSKHGWNAKIRAAKMKRAKNWYIHHRNKHTDTLFRWLEKKAVRQKTGKQTEQMYAVMPRQPRMGVDDVEKQRGERT